MTISDYIEYIAFVLGNHVERFLQFLADIAAALFGLGL